MLLDLIYFQTVLLLYSNKKRRVSMKNMVNYIQIDDFAKVNMILLTVLVESTT